MEKNCSIRVYIKLTGAHQFRAMTIYLLITICCVNILQLLSKINLLYRIGVMTFPGVRCLRQAAKPLKTN